MFNIITVCNVSLNSQLVGGPLIPPCPSWSPSVRVKDKERQQQTGHRTILLFLTVGTCMSPLSKQHLQPFGSRAQQLVD